MNKIGQDKINVFSHFSIFYFYFILQNGIKVYIFLILRSSRFKISNFGGLRPLWAFPAKKLRQGSTSSRHFGLKLIPEVAHFQSHFLLFHGLHDEHIFSFSIRIEEGTVPPHFKKKSVAVTSSRRFFSKNEKKHHWQIAARPQIPSGVEICPAV